MAKSSGREADILWREKQIAQRQGPRDQGEGGYLEHFAWWRWTCDHWQPRRWSWWRWRWGGGRGGGRAGGNNEKISDKDTQGWGIRKCWHNVYFVLFPFCLGRNSFPYWLFRRSRKEEGKSPSIVLHPYYTYCSEGVKLLIWSFVTFFLYLLYMPFYTYIHTHHHRPSQLFSDYTKMVSYLKNFTL